MSNHPASSHAAPALPGFSQPYLALGAAFAQLPEKVPLARPDEKGRWPDYIRVNASKMGAQFKDAFDAVYEPDFPPDPPGPRPKSRRPPPFSLEDLTIERTLGSGVEGKVYLVRTHRKEHPGDRPGSVYALKSSIKRRLRAVKLDRENKTGDYSKEIGEWIHRIDNERSKLVDLEWHPFICGILQVFEDTRNVYTLLELAPCGTLRALMQERGPMPQRDASFYFYNLVCAINFLIQSDVANRDVKPDNILIGQDGYLMLSDFGTATYLDDENDSWNERGTPFYNVPEFQRPVTQFPGDAPDDGERHFRKEKESVDLYAAACILFEMVSGSLPFPHLEDCLAEKWYHNIAWPADIIFGRNLRDLISRMLRPQPWKRPYIADVLKHPWLRHFNQQMMESRRYIPPYVPEPALLEKTWHTEPLPSQQEVPGIEVVHPPYHLAHDDRFPTWDEPLR